MCSSYGIMWMTPSSDIDFFKSLLILSLGFAYDYWSIRTVGVLESNSDYILLGTVGAFLACCFCLFSVFDLFGALTLALNNEPIMICTTNRFMLHTQINLDYFLYVLSAFPMLACGEIWGEYSRHPKT